MKILKIIKKIFHKMIKKQKLKKLFLNQRNN